MSLVSFYTLYIRTKLQVFSIGLADIRPSETVKLSAAAIRGVL